MAGVSPYLLKWNEGFLVLGTQFAGGVFLGTAMMHFLSDATEKFGDLGHKEYPFAFMLACVGYLLTMLADSVISSVLMRQLSNRTTRDGAAAADVELQGLSLFLELSLILIMQFNLYFKNCIFFSSVFELCCWG